jgi:hypothetical protein
VNQCLILVHGDLISRSAFPYIVGFTDWVNYDETWSFHHKDANLAWFSQFTLIFMIIDAVEKGRTYTWIQTLIWLNLASRSIQIDWMKVILINPGFCHAKPICHLTHTNCRKVIRYPSLIHCTISIAKIDYWIICISAILNNVKKWKFYLFHLQIWFVDANDWNRIATKSHSIETIH